MSTSSNINGELECLIQKILPRVAERIKKDLAPPFHPAPATKNEFPRVLCLDYCKWIDLARAHHGHRNGTPFLEALASVREAIASGRLLVPILGANMFEVVEPRDATRRRRTAEFMVSLSGNHSMLNSDALLRLELLSTIRKQLLGLDTQPFRHELLRWGLASSIQSRDRGNLKPASDGLIQQVLNEPEVSVHAMVHAIDRSTVERGRVADRRFVGAAQKARNAGLDERTRQTAEFWNVLKAGSANLIKNEVLKELEIPESDFSAWLDANLLDFCTNVPSLNVVAKLLLARDANPNHQTLPNDLKDLAFLEQAIPHANIVVAEKSWTHFVRRTSLDSFYETTILSRTTEIPRVLQEQGCLVANRAT